MAPDFHDKPDIFTLDEFPKGFLQVLLTQFTLHKEGEADQGRRIDLTLNEGLRALVSSAGKRQFFEVVRADPAPGERLTGDLAAFEGDPAILARRFTCESHPLRYGNGGVLPVIRGSFTGAEVTEYVCLFYRDIFPIGWNIANGASDNLDELKNPERILLREFGEELLLLDDEKRLVYSFDPGRDKDPANSPSKARKAWEQKHAAIRDYRTLSVPMTWVKGPDRVRVRYAGSTTESDGYFLHVVPEDNAVEVDRIALINVKGKVTFFDGEQSRGTTLNRAVGLFRVDRFKQAGALSEHRFEPDVVFYDGRVGEPAQLIQHVQAKVAELGAAPSPFRSPEEIRAWSAEERKLDLCPITRRMIRRYLDRAHNAADEPPSAVAPAGPPPAWDVFISYNAVDHVLASGMYEYFTRQGLRTFFAEDSVQRLGESRFASAIDRALESARYLVVLATRPECFDSGWMGYEWSSFHREIIAKRKPEGHLFTCVSGIAIDQLPFGLRGYQMIRLVPASPQDAFEELLAYLRPARVA